jgi:biotin transport system substrate-specific component
MNNSFSIQEMGRIALLAAVTCVLAFVIIPLPFSPVAVSGQTLGVMLAGLILSGRNAAVSQFVYVLLGIVGLPVFAGGQSGIGVLFGPTGGYIWGFVIGAYIIGKLTESKWKNIWLQKLMALIIGGVIVIYIFGLFQFMLVMDVSLGKAISLTMLPFLPGDVFKILIAILISQKIRLNKH